MTLPRFLPEPRVPPDYRSREWRGAVREADPWERERWGTREGLSADDIAPAIECGLGCAGEEVGP